MGIIPAQLLVYIFTVRIAREAFFPEAVFHDFPPGTGMSFVSIAFLPISHFFLPDHLNKKNGASQGVEKKRKKSVIRIFSPFQNITISVKDMDRLKGRNSDRVRNGTGADAQQ